MVLDEGLDGALGYEQTAADFDMQHLADESVRAAATHAQPLSKFSDSQKAKLRTLRHANNVACSQH
jgi:hypothetical protein